VIAGKKLKNQRGTAAVEFAIILPLLIIIVFGIIEFGTLLYDKAVITNASREGARAGIVAQVPRVADAAIQTIVTSYCNNNLISYASSPPVLGITTTADPSAAFGQDLTVTVIYPYTFLVLPAFITNWLWSGNITARTVMRYE